MTDFRETYVLQQDGTSVARLDFYTGVHLFALFLVIKVDRLE